MSYYMICILIYIMNSNTGATAVLNDFEEDGSISLENQDTVALKRIFRNDDRQFCLGKFSTRPFERLRVKRDTKRIPLFSKSPNNVYYKRFNDIYWPYQWFAHDQRVVDGPVMDHNLVPVYWRGHTGKGVVVGVIGDGVKRFADDLQFNVKGADYDSSVAYRMQSDPERNAEGVMNAEGTMMAGVIAMHANNSICGVGVAFNVDIVGINIRKKSSPLSDSMFADAITYGKYQRKEKYDVLCDIYAFAIGRPNDGIFMNTRKTIANALKKGVIEGRKGKGSIYVVGAGNGKTTGEDNCAADDFANDPNAVAIASADHQGRVTPYSERCSAVMATAYSGGAGGDNDEAIVTTEPGGSCTIYYSGNYPSVGIAAGIFALVLGSNSQLTARDMQHLIVATSEVAPLVNNRGTWTQNKAGFYVSNDFGFGLLNAENMVIAASKWITVPPMETTETEFTFNRPILEPEKLKVGTATLSTPTIKSMEQVELISTVNLEYRGSLMVNLTSPAGTKVVMLEERPRDQSGSGLKNWRIKTAHFWGENPTGTWVVNARIARLPEEQPSSGFCGVYNFLIQTFNRAPNSIKTMKLVVHGTQAKPEHYLSKHARTYSAFYSSELHGSSDESQRVEIS